MRIASAPVRRSITGCATLVVMAAAGQAAADDRRIAVTAAGHPVIGIVIQGEAVRISGTPGAPGLLGSLQGADKRKYRAAGGPVIAEVKFKPEATRKDPPGFKLRTPDGKLLWKVTFGDWKIKISAEEDGNRPWVISLEQPDKLKVLDPDGKEVGRVVLRDRVVVEDPAGQQRLVANLAGAKSALLGLLLIEAIPERDRWILMAEILAAGY